MEKGRLRRFFIHVQFQVPAYAVPLPHTHVPAFSRDLYAPHTFRTHTHTHTHTYSYALQNAHALPHAPARCQALTESPVQYHMELSRMHGGLVYNLPIPGNLMTVTNHPESFLSVLKTEWKYPTGAAETVV